MEIYVHSMFHQNQDVRKRNYYVPFCEDSIVFVAFELQSKVKVSCAKDAECRSISVFE